MHAPQFVRLLKANVYLSIFLFSPASIVFADGSGDPSLAEPNWDRRLALQAAGVNKSHREATRLISLVDKADSTAVMRALTQLAARTEWSHPAREAAIYEFTQKLRYLTPFVVDSAVLDFLLEYQVNVRVAHQESFTTGVPLFPIRSAAAGLVNQWTRQIAQEEAILILQKNPKALLNAYIANSHLAVRAGIESTIQGASSDSLMVLLNMGIPLLGEYPELTGLLGKTALESGDLQSVKDIFVFGKGSSLVELSRQVGQRFSSSETGDILLSALENAPPPTASIVVAGLAPYSIQQDSVAKALFNKLDDPALGSTVALTLAMWGNDQQIQALRNAAEKAPSSLAAKRAQTALSLESTITRGEGQ